MLLSCSLQNTIPVQKSDIDQCFLIVFLKFFNHNKTKIKHIQVIVFSSLKRKKYCVTYFKMVQRLKTEIQYVVISFKVGIKYFVF